MFFSRTRRQNEEGRDVLPGRAAEVETARLHYLSDHPLKGPYPAGNEIAYFGMGCFWGAERLFWRLEGVHVTAVGYAGGTTPNPTYDEVCTGRTGHAEVVKVVFDPARLPVDRLLAAFWEGHDPTQGMAQGNDVGPQYRSVMFTTTPAQAEAGARSRQLYGAALRRQRIGRITTAIAPAGTFYYAEARHQQYLAKNPAGYCGLAGTGVPCPLPVEPSSAQ